MVQTDIKSMEISKEDRITHLKNLFQKQTRDKELLDRVIPQIYHQEMFGEIGSIYPFKHVIYTLYASPDSGRRSAGFYRQAQGNRGGDRPIDDSR